MISTSDGSQDKDFAQHLPYSVTGWKDSAGIMQAELVFPRPTQAAHTYTDTHTYIYMRDKGEESIQNGTK
jgi:hypothetical protein